MSMHKVLIIGTGFGAMAAAIKLRKAGIDDFVMLERRSFAGGTWMQNTYPGAAVDVQSPLYSLADEPFDWSQMFVEREELERYTLHILSKHKLNERIQLNTTVESSKWDEEQLHWTVTTNQGQFSARFLINATGPLSQPVIPDFKGRDSFKGVTFHTNSWPKEIDLKGKKVGVIGSGASTAQIVPAIAEDVEKMHVFQRSPHWVLPRPDRKFTPWQRSLLRKPMIYNFVRRAIYWGLETRILGFKYSRFALENLVALEAKHHLKKQVPDKVLRKKLTPDYTIGCKRIILSNTLFPALGRPNVDLHDRQDGIDEITETGIRSGSGEHHDLDVIIYSTGYDPIGSLMANTVVGRDNTELKDVWAEYERAYLGTTLPKFPNFFIVTGPNTGIGHTSALFVIESQMNYIVDSIQQVLEKGMQSVEVTEEAEEQYTNKIHKDMERTVWHYGGCQSWYRSGSGKVTAMFPGFTFTYRLMARRMKPKHHIVS